MSASETSSCAGGGGGGVGGVNSTSTTALAATTTGAKITHVKTTTIDPNCLVTGSSAGVGAVTATNLVSTGAIKLTAAGGATTGTPLSASSTISSTPIALNAASSSGATNAAIRTIGASGQATQVRVVVPTNLMAAPSMIKQIESGRTQITAMPVSSLATARTVSNTSITVTRPITQTTYLPRANVTATPMAGIGLATTASGQRLVTPIRATPASNVTGLTAGGSFVRSATANVAVSRNTSSPVTTVISPATNTWMASNTAGQVQLIRAIPHATRQRIITTQGITTAAAGAVAGGTTATSGASGLVSGTIVAATNVGGAATTTQPTQIQTSSGQSTLQTVASSSAVSPHTSQQQQQQPTYVATLATVLPPRQHQATLVYSTNATGTAGNTSTGNSAVPTLTQQPNAQSFNPTLATGQRFAVATSLTAAAAAVSNAASARQIRQIPLAKPISTTKLSTASISIRTPNLPQLAPTLATVTGGAGGAGLTQGAGTVSGGLTTGAAGVRGNTVNSVTGSTATGTVLPGGNLSATRIIQLQQQPGSTAQQIIGSAGRLAGNVMLQPFIVNTSGGNKIGLRPPVTMAAKGQPSLTITHMGISKLPTTAANVVSASQAQNVAVTLQGLNATVASNLTTPTSITGITAATSSASNIGGGINVTNVSSTAAAVSLATTSGLLTTQNNITSAAGGATVVPLAITTRGGTITSIKNANSITVGKVMTASAAAGSPSITSGVDTTTSNTSVFLQQQQQQQRPGSAGGSSGSPALSTATQSVAPTQTSSVASSTAYLPAGSAIYYESIPASSVQVSTGVLSITTTTLTSSAMTSATSSTSGTNLNITTTSASSTSGLPFVAGANSATFTVVPTSNSSSTAVAPRTIGQLQLPITSAGGAQIQAVRFTTPLSTATTAAVSVSEVVSGVGQHNNTSVPQHMVIPLQTSIKVTTAGVPGSTVVSNFLRKRDNAGSIDGSPVRAAKNLAPTLLSMGASPAASSPPTSVSSTSSAIIGVAVSPAATLNTNLPSTSLSPAPSTSINFSNVSSSGFCPNNNGINSIQQTSSSNVGQSTTAPLTVEAVTKKDRAANLACGLLPRCSRGASPASSDGSTTVSANSSPGVERQMVAQDENSGIKGSGNNAQQQQQPHAENVSSTHFNPIHELYPNHHKQQHSLSIDQQHQNATLMDNNQLLHLGVATSSSSTATSLLISSAAMSQRLNGSIGSDGGPPNKRSRRATTDSQQSNQSQPSSSYAMNANAAMIAGSVDCSGVGNSANVGTNMNCNLLSTCSIQPDDINSSNSNHSSTNQHKMHASNNNNPQTQMAGNKENAKPVEYFLRRPRNCTMMNSYKTNWKAANNHFQRHTDVKQREERRPTVIDVANQVNIQGKLGGWKIHHLRAQMEDLAENESSSFEKLTEMLKQIETHEKTPEIEKICDLLKGNIQRNKIIVDGINEAKNQIMKIFDYQTPVSEILSRCASKRNFKKRDKV